MLFSDATGRKVVSTTTAATAGRVHDYVIDPSGPRVAAVLLKKGEGDTLRWADIQAFGTDAVTVETSEKITKGGDDLTALLDKRNQLHKKRVLTTTGDELGSVRDIDFDASTGMVNTLVLEQGEVAGSRLIGVGTYAVVVESESATPPTPAGPEGGAAAPPAEAHEAARAPAAEDVEQPAQASGAQPAPSPETVEPTSLDLAAEPAPLTLTPPDLSQAERASYPPVE